MLPSRIAVLTAGFAAMAALACDQQSSLTDSDDAFIETAVYSSAPQAQSSVVTPFPTGIPIPGAFATRMIVGNGINVSFHTNGLVPGNAYTLWLAVFNHPGNCVTPFACSGPDVMAPDPAVGVDLIGVTGIVAGGNGVATFAGRVHQGQLGIMGVGLINLHGAQIELAVRSHGPKLAGSAQLFEFNGGCPPNVCINVQAAAQF